MTVIQQLAAKALIVNKEGKVLIVRQAQREGNTKAGQYGMVGGRLLPGEAFETALYREVKEEVGLEVELQQPIYIGEWRPKIKGITYQIVAVFCACKAKSTAVVLNDENDDYKWIDPSKRKSYNMMEPDCYAVDRFVAQSAHLIV